MADKNGIWSFVLKIVIQILNFIFCRISKKKTDTNVDNIQYKQDEQENVKMKEKISKQLKKKLQMDEVK